MKLGILLTFFISINSFAYGYDSYDGNIILCPGQAPVTLDYFDAALPVLNSKGPNVVNLKNLSEKQVIDFVLQRLEGTLYREKLELALKAVGPVARWIMADLKDTTSNWAEYDLPSECKRVQGSASIADVIYIDPLHARSLSHQQLALLQIHEAIHLVGIEDQKLRGMQYSSDKDMRAALLRELFRRLLVLDYTSDDIAESIRELGYKAYPYEVIIPTDSSTFKNTNPEDKTRPAEFNVLSDEYHTPGAIAEARRRGEYFLDVTGAAYPVKIRCTKDARECLVMKGDPRNNGWTPGCKINITSLDDESGGYNWGFSCPGSDTVWNYRQ